MDMIFQYRSGIVCSHLTSVSHCIFIWFCTSLMWLKKFLPFRLVNFFIQLKAAPGCSREKLNPVKLVMTPWIRRYWWTKYRFQFIFYCIRTNHSVLLLLSTILFVWLLCRNHQLIHQSKLSWGFSQVLFQGESLWHLRGFYFELLGVTFFLGRLLLRNLLQILFQERRYFSCFSYFFFWKNERQVFCFLVLVAVVPFSLWPQLICGVDSFLCPLGMSFMGNEILRLR